MSLLDEARTLAEDVFRAPYTPYSGVYEMLDAYRRGGWQMILCTKGDEKLQNHKVDKHKLRGYFDAIHVVSRKGSEVLAAILEERDVDPLLSWYVGDSPKDDIGPAKECGLMTVEIATGDGRWAYEDQPHVGHHEVTDVTETLEIIPVQVPVEGRTVQAGT